MKTAKQIYYRAAISMLAATLMLWGGGAVASTQIPQVPLPGKAIPKFIDPLPIPARIDGTLPLTVTMSEFDQQVLPLPFPLTTVWGYNGTYPGPTIVAQRGTPTNVTYINNLVDPANPANPPKLQKYLTVDQTLHWADPLTCMMTPGCNMMLPYAGPVPAVAHLHGGEVPSAFDGAPDAWFTPNATGAPVSTGPGFVTNVYSYPNAQQGTTLWYHDHALGTTRLNVYGGLAGFYFLRDPANTPTNLPGGAADNPMYEVEVVIQDRMFDTAGQLLFPDLGINPTIHPFWIPEFVGDSIVVNGKTWPTFNVEPRKYRLRLLNGSNARFYSMALINPVTGAPGPAFWQIGTDGGFLDAPTILNDPVALAAGLPSPRMLIAPGERADIIIDFSAYAGQTLLLNNTARTPFPKGAPVDPKTTGQIMQILVGTTVTTPDTAVFNPALPGATLRGANPILRLNPATATLTRQLTLNEVMGMGGPLEVLLNNTKWNGLQAGTATPIPGSTQVGTNWLTELPRVGATEVWEIVNLTADAHPIHLHLIQFQLLNRQPFQTNKYLKAYNASFHLGAFLPAYGPPYPYSNIGNPTLPVGSTVVGGNPDVTPYLQKNPAPALANENGWKDTVIVYPGEVTRFVVRYATQDAPLTTMAGTNTFPFDPTAGIGTLDAFGFPGGTGYVWHCHILDHEDNEMMRPYMVQP